MDTNTTQDTTTTPTFDPNHKVMLELDANELGLLANALNFTVCITKRHNPFEAMNYSGDINLALDTMGPKGYNDLNVRMERLIHANFPGLFATDILHEPAPEYLPDDYAATPSKVADDPQAA